MPDCGVTLCVCGLLRGEAPGTADLPSLCEEISRCQGMQRGELLKLCKRIWPSIKGPVWIMAGLKLGELRDAVSAVELPESVSRVANALVGKGGSGMEAAEVEKLVEAGGERVASRVEAALAKQVEAAMARMALLVAGGASPAAPVVGAPGSRYRPSAELSALAGVVDRMARNGERTNLRVVGPAGCGKTQGMEWMAESLKRECFIVNCGLLVEPSDFFGQVGLVNGSTEWDWAPFAEAVETPGMVVVLDEANRMAPAVANGVLPLLDYRGESHPPGCPRSIKVAAGVVFAATMNIGAQYTGTERMDAALASRLSMTVEIDYMGAADEVELLVSSYGVNPAGAELIVRVAGAVRAAAAESGSGAIGLDPEPVSTRATMAAGRMLAAGAGLELAVRSSMVLPYSPLKLGGVSPRDRVAALVAEVFAVGAVV